MFVFVKGWPTCRGMVWLTRSVHCLWTACCPTPRPFQLKSSESDEAQSNYKVVNDTNPSTVCSILIKNQNRFERDLLLLKKNFKS